MKIKDNIHDYNLTKDPIETFNNWFQSALEYEENARAMAVATCGSDGYPHVRYLLYKEMISNKLPLYTNFLSNKAQNLKQNPKAEIAFYWHRTKKQVRIMGDVEVMPESHAQKYFFTRSRDSQLASFISHQTEAIESREALIQKFHEAKEKFHEREIPYPENWGGFLLTPIRFEFFLYNEFRLNDRFVYKKQNDDWDIERLQP